MNAPTVYAVAPNPGAWRIHLYVEGYVPKGLPFRRPKTRGVKSPMCGAYVSCIGDARMVPLREALRWPDRKPTPEDMRPRQAWCPSCLGHAAELLGVADNLARGLAWEERISSSPGTGVQGQMVTRAKDLGSSDPVVTGGLGVAPITKGALP